MSEGHRRARLLSSSAKSSTRVLRDRRAVAGALADAKTRERLKDLVKPNSVPGTLRKTGVALILAPDPVTGVAGVAMLGASLAMQGKKPLTPTSVYEETQRLLEEMDSLL